MWLTDNGISELCTVILHDSFTLMIDSYIICQTSRSSHLAFPYIIHRGSNMSAHVLLNSLNELGKRDNNTRARMLDSTRGDSPVLKHF